MTIEWKNPSDAPADVNAVANKPTESAIASSSGKVLAANSSN
ncbi:hypothetical protein QUA35_10870 [Microcoleus sp. N9_B2]